MVTCSRNIQAWRNLLRPNSKKTAKRLSERLHHLQHHGQKFGPSRVNSRSPCILQPSHLALWWSPLALLPHRRNRAYSAAPGPKQAHGKQQKHMLRFLCIEPAWRVASLSCSNFSFNCLSCSEAVSFTACSCAWQHQRHETRAKLSGAAWTFASCSSCSSAAVRSSWSWNSNSLFLDLRRTEGCANKNDLGWFWTSFLLLLASLKFKKGFASSDCRTKSKTILPNLEASNWVEDQSSLHFSLLSWCVRRLSWEMLCDPVASKDFVSPSAKAAASFSICSSGTQLPQ